MIQTACQSLNRSLQKQFRLTFLCKPLTVQFSQPYECSMIPVFCFAHNNKAALRAALLLLKKQMKIILL